MLTKFQLDQAETGHKVLLRGMPRLKWCPPCSRVNSVSSLLSCRHVLECGAVQEARDHHGLQTFMNECVEEGHSTRQAYEFYVNGLDAKEMPVTREAYMARGAAIMEIYDTWKKMW